MKCMFSGEETSSDEHATVATRVVVSFRSDGWVRSYDDGAQLYRCTYRAPLAFANACPEPCFK